MPPRPRPRFCSVLTPSSPAALKASGSISDARPSSSKDDEDEDNLFIRNRGRSLKEVNKRVARAAAIACVSSSSTGSEDEDEVEEDTPKQLGRIRKQNIFNAGKAKAPPKWAKKGAIKSLLRDSDSEVENNDPAYDASPTKRHACGSGTPSGKCGKRARTRSRSRSLTPPPDLTEAEKLRAQLAIQHALRSGQESVPLRMYTSVMRDDEEGPETYENMALDPELQQIAQTIRNRASKQKGDGHFNTQQSRPENSREDSGGRPAVVTVRVKWVHHPEDDAAAGRPQQSWMFTVKRHDSFKELFMHTSDKTHVVAEDLVLMRDGKQVFTSVSPAGLGIWDKVDLEACDRITFEAVRSHSFRSPTPVQQDAKDHESDREMSAAPSEASASLESSDTEKFKLVLRAPGTKEITLGVKSTTTCGKIVRAFLAVAKKHGSKVPASPRKAAQVRLCIDGEKQDPDTPISECDLEDGDMVEVVGM